MRRTGNIGSAYWSIRWRSIPADLAPLRPELAMEEVLEQQGWWSRNSQAWKKHRNNVLAQKLDEETSVACSTSAYANSAPVMGSRTHPFVLVDEAAQAAEFELGKGSTPCVAAAPCVGGIKTSLPVISGKDAERLLNVAQVLTQH